MQTIKSFTGRSITTLDMDVLSSAPCRSNLSKNQPSDQFSFEKRASMFVKELEASDPTVVYSTYGIMTYDNRPQAMLHLAMVGQDYIIAPNVQKMNTCCIAAVYYKKQLLWLLKRFKPGMAPFFLNQKWLTKKMNALFGMAEINLGMLTENTIHYIAWQIKTPKGVFYIPWHSGCFIPATSEIEFVPQSFQELRRTYKVLRFMQKVDDRGAYKILCA